MSSIFIIDDDNALCRSLEIQLGAQGHEVQVALNGSDGLLILAEWTPDLVLLDLQLPDQSGLDVLHKLQNAGYSSPVVMITGRQDTKATIEAMRSGAFDYIRKPFELDDLFLMIEKAKRFGPHGVTDLSKIVATSLPDAASEIVGADKKIVEVVKQIGLLSRSRVTVLIQGETGTGKELVARALHEATSPGEPFVAVNCSAVVPTLFESELFGHKKGSFTGADAHKIGKMESAGSGTIFFDEIGDMPLDLQAKILRVLQESEFERVGSLESTPLKARVLTATNRDLEKCVENGEFRQDLLYRLTVSRIVVPPLRERRRDIPLIARHLIGKISARLHRQVKGIEREAMRSLQVYDWPGNVRELENVLTRAIALSQGDILTVEELEFSVRDGTVHAPITSEIAPLEQVEKEHIKKALHTTGWNITRTAKLLRISPTTLRKKISDFDLRNAK